jgi:hypothetical protein
MFTSARRYGVWLVALAVLGLAGCSGSDDKTSSGTATTGPAGGATEPAPPASTQQPSVGISTAPAVRIGHVTKIQSDVEILIGKVREVTISGKVAEPGTIAGPAVAVELKVKNSSEKPFSVGGLVVNANFKGGLPGDPTTAKPAKRLTGDLAPGKTATGVYVFMIPKKATASSASFQVISDQSPTIVTYVR